MAQTRASVMYGWSLPLAVPSADPVYMRRWLIVIATMGPRCASMFFIILMITARGKHILLSVEVISAVHYLIV